MKANDMRGMSQEDLNKELLNLRREQFSLRMQRATGQLARPHEYGRVKKDIARVKTILGELKQTSASE
ncbi:50S ribosomal subunit protein L29 [uncultured Woeseiaceae bacterium]|jgi:large subunit ribosomal protein L29|uniref:Large ribosomal subunit protein uL29 n=1 Tax=uncultured Woeseiaceae bacterium TaxID=1983305 RepID=A0A7D9D1U9_9GAMM|nr:50S ribosomal subunit protein L29 [uncultured Woeseiaceae bacterium]